MKKTFALAALLAATAFTPVSAQEEPREGRRMMTATEAAPATSEPLQIAQRDRGPRGDGDGRPQWNGGQGRPDGGWQRRERAAPAAPAPVQVEQAPAQRQWNGGSNGGQRNWQGQPNWQGRERPDWTARAQGGQVEPRPTPPVATPPVQPQGNWGGREQRRDTWRNGNGAPGGVVTPQPDRRDWNRNNGWNGQTRNEVQQNDGRARDGWRNDGRNDRQWNGDRRNDTWRNDARRNDGWRNDTWRNDTWRNDRRDGRVIDQRRQWQNQYRDWNRSWSRDWRRDQRYDWQRYRYSNRSLFQGSRYYAPYGWDYGYRRFSIGFSLSYLLYDQQYWIDDPYNYRLPPVYGPYRWVRYYDDVLLVDLRSGQVVDAIYDFFW